MSIKKIMQKIEETFNPDQKPYVRPLQEKSPIEDKVTDHIIGQIKSARLKDPDLDMDKVKSTIMKKYFLSEKDADRIIKLVS